MAIVHQLMGLHGGTIDVDSELGSGTTCTLIFPDEETAPKQKKQTGSKTSGNSVANKPDSAGNTAGDEDQQGKSNK